MVVRTDGRTYGALITKISRIDGYHIFLAMVLRSSAIRCHFSIRMCFRLGTDGLYCVTKGNISLRTFVFSWRAFFLSENLTSESVLSVRLFGKPLARRRSLNILMFSTKVSCEELVLSSLRPSPFTKPFLTPGG